MGECTGCDNVGQMIVTENGVSLCVECYEEYWDAKMDEYDEGDFK